MLNVCEINIADLKPWDKNPRINDHAVESVAKSIEKFGFNVPILCDQNYTIIAGHTRLKAAKKLGMEKVPVITLEMSDSQKEAFSIADNKLSSLAEWNDVLLIDIFKELKSEEFDLSSLGYTNAEIETLLSPEKNFNWKDFDEYLTEETSVLFANIPIRVKSETKEELKTVIKKYAVENKLVEKDSAITSGRVLCHLLGVDQ